MSGAGGSSTAMTDTPRRASYLNMLGAQALLELRLTLRRGESVLITIVVPALLLVFFASVVTLPDTGQRPVDALVPGILALAVMSTAMVSLGIATAFERQYGVLKRLGGSPLPRPILLLAKTLAVLVVELIQVLALLALALALGWRAGGNAALALLALLLGTAAFGGLGLWMAGAWRAEAALAGANGLYLVLLLLGGIFVPVANLPAGLGRVAGLLPSAALADVLRAALLPDAALPVGFPLAILCAWAVAGPALASLTFRWE